MSRLRQPLEGKTFYLLTVISYVGNNKWLCRCDCGNETIVSASNLRTGNTKSCGCLKGRPKVFKESDYVTYSIGVPLPVLNAFKQAFGQNGQTQLDKMRMMIADEVKRYGSKKRPVKQTPISVPSKRVGYFGLTFIPKDQWIKLKSISHRQGLSIKAKLINMMIDAVGGPSKFS